MWAVIQRLLTPPVFEGDEDKNRSAQLINTLLWLVFGGVIIFAGSVLFTLQNEMEPIVLSITIVLGIVCILMFAILRIGYVIQAGIILAFTLWIGFTIPMFTFAGIHDSAITGYFFIIAMVGVISGWRTLLFFTMLTTASLITAFYFEQVGILVATVPLPSKIDDLILVLLMLGSTALMLWYAVQRVSRTYDRLRINARALEESNQELVDARETVEIQAKELAQRAHYLSTTTKIAEESAALLDNPKVMMRRVVEIIADAFDYYLVSIFLVDARYEWVELQAASSAEGQKLIDRNYRLRIGKGWAGEGIVGNVADSGQMRITLDVDRDDVYVNTTEVPNTKSEIAFPLMARGKVIGVLDMQSQRSETYLDAEIELMQGLVNQVSLAVDNARLVIRLQASSAEQQWGYGRITSEDWVQLMESEETVAVSDGQGSSSGQGEWQPEMIKAAQTGKTVVNDYRASVCIPIFARNQVVGVIDAQLPITEGQWTVEQLDLLRTITQQLGTALESAQLYRNTQRHAVRETLSRQIVDKMRNTVNWEDLLQTALSEITEATGATRAFVQWLPSDDYSESQND